MYNTKNATTKHRIIQSKTTSECFFIILTCLFWASGILGFVFVAADKVLGTGLFIRSVGEIIIYLFFALGSLSYCSSKIRPLDMGFILLFLILYFFAPASKYVPSLEFKNFTRNFLWALPLYLIGISLDFSKLKKLFHVLSIAAIVTSAYYNLLYIHAADYSGSVEFSIDNMSASYELVLPVMYMIWYTFENFRMKSIMSWVDLTSILLGMFAMSMLGTRGSLICVFLFLISYLFFFKVKKYKILYGILFLIIGYVIVGFANNIFLLLGNLAVDWGFSDRIFVSFLSGENLLTEGSSGRDSFYPILFKALGESPIWGYGIYGSYEFIRSYPHNIFMDIIFTFGYFFGGIILLYGAYSITKAFRNNITDDEKGFLFVLIGSGIMELLFSSMFIITSSFFFFVGFCFQMAYRK